MTDGAAAGSRRAAVDLAWVAELQRRLRALAPKPLRVLLVTDATMKYQERAILNVFGRAPLAACDCWQAAARDRSFRPALPGLRYVDEREALAGAYDRVIGFDANVAAVRAAAHHRCPAVFVGKLRGDGERARPEDLARLPRAIDVYTTHASADLRGLLDRFLGPDRWAHRGGIDFPPNVDVHLAPGEPTLPCFVPGGGDRDYAVLARAAHALRGPVHVVRAGPEGQPPDQASALAALRRDPRFVLHDWLAPTAYLGLLLAARTVVLPVLGDATFEYTSLSDAVWYGRPVLTNRVRATAHLADRVTFFDGPDELAARLRELDDPERWRAESRRARERARASSDLHRLALAVYDAL